MQNRNAFVLDKCERDVVMMELKIRINQLAHSNGYFRTHARSLNSWKLPTQFREIEVLRGIVKKLEEQGA